MLGPPVCDTCWVIPDLEEDRTWRCPFCNRTNLWQTLMTCDKSFEELEENKKFLDFVTGKKS